MFKRILPFCIALSVLGACDDPGDLAPLPSDAQLEQARLNELEADGSDDSKVVVEGADRLGDLAEVGGTVVLPAARCDEGCVRSLLADVSLQEALDAAQAAEVSTRGLEDLSWSAVEAFVGESTEGVLDAGGVDHSRTPSYTIELDRKAGSLHVSHRSRMFTDAADTLTADEIERIAAKDLATLGVDLSASSSLEVRRLMRRDSDAAAPTPLAYKVFVQLAVDGVEVRGPRIGMSYYLDGELHKASVRWPSLESGADAQSISSDEVVAQVADALADHSLGQIDGPLVAAVRLTAVDGVLAPTVTLRGDLPGPSGMVRGSELDVRLQ